MNCGQSLELDSAADDRQLRLSATAPAPLVEKMRNAKLTGERKPVTALFADIVGSTTLAEHMDPEDWTQIVNEAFDLMSKAVFHYEGTIAQLQGDAMLAFFGAPVAHEDDPERSVRAALEMIETVGEYAAQLKSSQGIDFRIRAGINSGPVIVGNVGSDLRYEYTALGDAVNVAARVQTAAEPNTVLVTAMTQRFITGTFEFEDRGDVEVKGKTEPLHLYRVLGLRAERLSSRGLSQVGLSSPLVGRDAELQMLVDTFQIVRAGRGRVADRARRAGHRKVPAHGRVQDRDRRVERRLESSLDRGPLRQLRSNDSISSGLRPRAFNARAATDRSGRASS